MKTFPCAKINIGLNVVERRPDGYHNLKTIFYPIPLCDELEVELSGQTFDTMTVEGIPVEGDWQDNLVYRVVKMLREDDFPIPPLCIRLIKHIPSGAGLGGGSSDAAFMLRMLNEICHLGFTVEEMEHRVSRLGADCAFFVQCKPIYATGIGDQFHPIDLNLAGMHLVLVKPSDFVSTKEAYAGVTPCPSTYPLISVSRTNIEEWQQRVANDFERSVFPLHPTIKTIKQQLYTLGARYACMSGSGSSVFGLFNHCLDPKQLEEAFGEHFLFTADL